MKLYNAYIIHIYIQLLAIDQDLGSKHLELSSVQSFCGWGVPPLESHASLCHIYLMLVYVAVTTVYVRKKEEKVYNALMLDSLTILDFKLQVCGAIVTLQTSGL